MANPPLSRTQSATPQNPIQPAGPGYAELHCRTNFSFLEGASHPDELVQRSAELGYRALAITDRNSVAGVVRAHVAAREVGLKLLIGAEITPADAPPVVLLAPHRAAYGRLTRLITQGRRAAPKGECHLTFDDVADHAEGLLACVILEGHDGTAGGRRADENVGQTFLSAIHCQSISDGRQEYPPHADQRATWLGRYREAFADRCYAMASLHRGPDDRLSLEAMAQLARRVRLPLVASNEVHYHIPERRYLQDVVTAIRLGRPVSELGERLFANAERHLASADEMRQRFAGYPQAVERTLEVAGRCSFSLDELRYEYPEELCPRGMSAIEFLRQLTLDGASRRYPQGVSDKVRGLIEHELQLIERLRYEPYFLTVWDLVRFARGRGILCQGRGSAANSVVCYCLEVTSVDPERIDVLFERFISQARDEAPDIDVDFEHERREEVLQYVYDKYGRDRAGMTAEIITYRPRSAVRDVGKALGLSLDRVDLLAKSLAHDQEGGTLAIQFQEAGLEPTSVIARQLVALTRQLLGFPRHLSQHVGGMVMTQGPLCELVPIENAAMADRTVVQWDKNDLDSLGILKVDCLALGMLTAIRKCFSLIAAHEGTQWTLASVPAEDASVYEMISRADTIGVFQIESRAQMSMLPRLRPKEFYDLVIEVAIVRPGPIQGDMVHPYLRRRCRQEAVEYPDERIEAVLHKTLGVPIFQEQAMRLAVVAAGFTPDEADQLRRAMAAWRRSGVIEKFQAKLVDGMLANGYSLDFAERLFRQIRGFGEYGFPESHAASFALLVYVSSWLKHYYPAPFTAALLNSQPMGFYAPAQLIADARKHHIEVRPVDVCHSCWDCTLEESSSSGAGEGKAPGDRSSRWALRLGMRLIRGLSSRFAETIVRCRQERAFSSYDDFARRTELSPSALQRLARADAFGSFELDRRWAQWRSLRPSQEFPLFAGLEEDEPVVELEPMSPLENVVSDYQTVSLTLRDHPVKFIRPALDRRNVLTAESLGDEKYHGKRMTVRVAGLVICRQRPGSANGTTFVTLEDETGIANLIVHQDIWEKNAKAARRAKILMAEGPLQEQDSVIHVVVKKLVDLSGLLADMGSTSRDFH